MRPTERTLKRCRQEGRLSAVVERWNPHVKPHGIRQDMFGIIDIVSLDPSGVIGIQACSGSGYQSHLRKLTKEKATESRAWLETPGTRLQIWAWRKLKVKRGGKAVVWKPRIEEIRLEDLG